MCRLLGVVSASERSFEQVLSEAPRSMLVLSDVHRDGWGVAASRSDRGWVVERNTVRAGGDPRFLDLARSLMGDVMLAHVRQQTRGQVAVENTHPFSASGWVFAHNGTVQDVGFLERRISAARRAEIQGATDSERLFAFLLTRLDESGATASTTPGPADLVLLETTRALRNRRDFGTASFILSNGRWLYAHRFGRPLYVLQRRKNEPLNCARCSPVDPCVAVSSEPITMEPWTELPDGTLIRVDRRPEPRWRVLEVVRDWSGCSAIPPSRRG